MTIARKIRIAAPMALLVALAGCQAMTPPPMGTRLAPNAAPQMQGSGVEGEWASTDGVAISRFNNGSFETVASDTGNRLSEGRYNYGPGGNVEISMRSLIRQTTSRVNCSSASPSQLNCTSESGNRFSLVRRQGMS